MLKRISDKHSSCWFGHCRSQCGSLSWFQSCIV